MTRSLRRPLLEGVFTVGLVAGLAACQEPPEQAPVRSLRASGEVTYVCVGPDQKGRPLADCPQGPTLDDGGLTVAEPGNELVALVTQTVTAEVAVVRLTGESAGSSTAGVVDVDPSNPGITPLRVGSGPLDIVTTPGGMATFVGVADTGRNGIFALPTSCIGAPRPGEMGRDLTSWPACQLPSAPGDMAVVVDPATADGEVRVSCQDGYVAEPSVPEDGAALREECPADLSLESVTPGRRKLAVALPDLGRVAIIDAQALLDRQPGTFGECPIEALVELNATVPGAVSQSLPPDLVVDGCTTSTVEYSFSESFTPRPAGMALDGSRLFIADQGSPLVHVLDVSDPCSVVEQEPLVATSFLSPERVVTTSRVAVSPVSTTGQQFVYAIDELGEDASRLGDNVASVMVFDVSPGQSQRTPLVRANSALVPFEPPDRIEFAAAAKDVTFALHDRPLADLVTGEAVIGTRCDPNPGVDLSSPAARYRSSSSFDSGAGPNTLRGLFGFVLLSNGQVAVIDVDDFDAACRRPRTTNQAAREDFRGCVAEPDQPELYTLDGGPNTPATVSDEVSCRVVEPHRARSGDVVLTSGSGIGIGAPSLRSFPRLFQSGRGLSNSRQTEVGRRTPLLLGVDFENPVASGAPVPAEAFVGTSLLKRGDGQDDLVIDPRIAEHASLVLPWNEPRAYPRSEQLTVRFEGPLAGDLRTGFFSTADSGSLIEDQSAHFCDLGVQDVALTADMGREQFGLSGGALERFAARHADYVQITSDLLPEDDSYWDGAGASCGGGGGYSTCLGVFGETEDEEDLLESRDFSVVEAYQGRLSLAPRSGQEDLSELLSCCFPGVLSYRVRGGNQWIVSGSVSGFRHTVRTGADDRCVRDCAPWRPQQQGRAFEISGVVDCDATAPELDPACAVGPRTNEDVVCAFDQTQGPVEPGGPASECIFNGLTARFAVYRGLLPSGRDMTYAVDVQGGFAAQTMLLTGSTSVVLPLSIQQVPGFNQLSVVDSQDRGLMLLGLVGINGGAPGLRQSFF